MGNSWHMVVVGASIRKRIAMQTTLPAAVYCLFKNDRAIIQACHSHFRTNPVKKKLREVTILAKWIRSPKASEDRELIIIESSLRM